MRQAIYHLTHNVHQSGGDRDFMSREIIITPFDGCYGLAGVMITVNGSPPKGEILVRYRFDRDWRGASLAVFCAVFRGFTRCTATNHGGPIPGNTRKVRSW